MNDFTKFKLQPSINNISEATALDIYSQQLAQFDLLSVEGERALGKKINTEMAKIISEICSTPQGLEQLSQVVENYLQIYQSADGTATKRWKYDPEPNYIANLASTLIDTLEVILFLDEESKQRSHIQNNLIALLQSLSLGRQQIIEIAEQLQDQREQLKGFIQNYLKLRSELIEKNLRLVYTVAGRFNSSGVSYDDLIQEGNVGLLKAADRFNFNKGFRFSTYAFWCIQNVLKTALQKRYHTISRPSYLQEKLSLIKRARAKFVSKHERQPTTKELASLSGIPLATLEKINTFPSEPLSLNHGIGVEDDSTLLEEIIADKTKEADVLSEQQLKRKLLDRICKKLTDREYLVLKLRFGIDSRREHTLEEISYQLNVSVERVRQMQKNAMKKLQNYD
ncbi:RNA polymerase sigma factor RpoD/SigA [Neptuniibacter sp. SY11_33]|uniref:sigma-70 family RNA polymerase sigma factor n=1 Tax=Neptuniibacter sp. SY11_33 TaxID=3398215 RepID=UPI0039F45017